MRISLSVLLILFPLSSSAFIWPFGKKRFKSNGLISAGSLGLDSLNGRVAAFGDFDGNQFLDVVSLSEDQKTVTLHLWDHDAFSYKQGASITLDTKVHNVIPGDFNYDGKLDLLVMSESLDATDQLDMAVYFGTFAGFSPSPLPIQPSALQQPIPIDSNGNMKIDLLGLTTSTSSNPPSLTLWQNVRASDSPTLDKMFDLVNPQFVGGEPCELANPHGNAVLDFDGDCLADLFLVCKSKDSSRLLYQIWLTDKSGVFKFARSGTLPEGIGAISFADMDRDGTIDIVFPTCSTISSSTGIGTDCHLNIVYNKQKPLCSTVTSTVSNRNCRSPDDLCVADSEFSFNFDISPDNQFYSRFPLSSILPNVNTPSLLLFDTTHSPPLPVPLRTGDIDLDGFPDILAVIAYNPHGGILGMNQVYDTTPFIFHSAPCTALAGCLPNKRTFEYISKHVEPLETIKDARGVAFLDMDEDGTLDILVQRTGKQEGGGTKVTFIQNNFFHDAFFLKAIVLNGACSGWCYPPNNSEPRYHPFGVSYSGASYKYTILDTNGRRSAAQIAQLPQTAYQALLTPYSFFGLGRTNNYIENLFVGSTKHSTKHYINMEGVIPNSKVVIMPTREGDDGMWRRELYLRPGEWIPWVTLTVAVATFILAGIVFMLHLNEKREDEMERRRALHHINFDAL